jgi:hypothetical protein
MFTKLGRGRELALEKKVPRLYPEPALQAAIDQTSPAKQNTRG